MAELDPNGTTIQLGDLGLRTPNLIGTADAVDATTGTGVRSAGGTTTQFQAALDRAQMETTHVVEIQATELTPTPGGRRGRAAGGQQLQLDVPAPPDGFEQAVLSVDAHGVTTWSFAPRPTRGRRTRGAGETRTFTIRRTPGAPPPIGAGGDRSIFGEAGKQLLKVIAFPLGDAAGELVNDYLAQWERAHQGYGIRDYLTDSYTQPVQPDGYFNSDAAHWEKLSQGRTLLFIHGTFSRASGAFNRLPLESMKAIQAMYGDRVIAFDHQSISRDPTENIAWLLDTIPDGVTLDLDIICHSRGGLVARSLTERTDPLPGTRKIKVHRTVLVGAVDNGTILADVKHWNDLIDTLSTVLNTVGFVVNDTVDLVLSFVRQVAVAAYPHLRGLACMVPGGKFLQALNAQPRGDNDYLAIASNYEPKDDKLSSFFRNVVTDGLFSEKPNDSMVRVDSVCGTGASGEFAVVDNQFLLDETKGVEHSGYFADQEVADKLVSWLKEGL